MTKRRTWSRNALNLYIAQSAVAPDWIKIGISDNPVVRVHSVRCPCNQRPKLLRVFDFGTQSREVEQRAHALLRGTMFKKRTDKEWFLISEQEALWAVLAAKKDIDGQDRRHFYPNVDQHAVGDLLYGLKKNSSC